jgi:hypothetical protein
MYRNAVQLMAKKPATAKKEFSDFERVERTHKPDWPACLASYSTGYKGVQGHVVCDVWTLESWTTFSSPNKNPGYISAWTPTPVDDIKMCPMKFFGRQVLYAPALAGGSPYRVFTPQLVSRSALGCGCIGLMDVMLCQKKLKKGFSILAVLLVYLLKGCNSKSAALSY